MAIIITDEILTEIMEMVREHLWQEQDKIDSLFCDDDRNRKVTVGLTVNMAGKSEHQIELKATVDFVEVPAIPAKKIKHTSKRLIDLAQKELPGLGKKKTKQKQTPAPATAI